MFFVWLMVKCDIFGGLACGKHFVLVWSSEI